MRHWGKYCGGIVWATKGFELITKIKIMTGQEWFGAGRKTLPATWCQVTKRAAMLEHNRSAIERSMQLPTGLVRDWGPM